MSKKQSSPSSQVQKTEPKREIIPAKKYSLEDAKNFTLECTEETIGIKSVLRKYANNFMGKDFSSLTEKDKEEMNEHLTTISFAYGVETGHIVSSCTNESFQKMAFQMKKELEKEFDCKSYSEKALVDLAVNGYVRAMRYSWKMEGNQTYIGQKYDGYRNYLSHEIDRAQRHYISAIETLKFMKQPSLRVNIKTNNAFVGENQQFNNNAKNNEAK
ncbi:MAG: hypothetical protein ACWGHO_02760 [Candidatus Moraniibacteriota bacterium]